MSGPPDLVGNRTRREPPDFREPYGLCRWCGDDNGDEEGLWLLTPSEDKPYSGEWYECWACMVAVCEIAAELEELGRNPGTRPRDDGDEIRLRSALIRAEEGPDGPR